MNYFTSDAEVQYNRTLLLRSTSYSPQLWLKLTVVFFSSNPIKPFLSLKEQIFCRKRGLEKEAISALHFYYLEILQSLFWRKLKTKPFSYKMLWLEPKLWLSSSPPFIKQFGFLQKLHMKNYENYSSIMLESFPWKIRLFIIFFLKCPFSHQRTKETSSAAQMHSHYLWFASWGILEDFCHQKQRKGKFSNTMEFLQCVAKILGGRMSLSIHREHVP